VIQIVQHFVSARKPVAAICHGPQLLAAAGGLADNASCAYPAVKPEKISGGGKFVAASDAFDNAHVDEWLVSAPAWPAQPAWMRSFLEVLGTKIQL
jgi:protease I